MSSRPRVPEAIAVLLAAAGVVLAVQAWRAGSLFRYVLAGQVAGALLCTPLLSFVVLRARARRCWRIVLFASVPLAGALALLELGVRMFGPAPEQPALLMPHARLGHVFAPGSGGTDAQGFRNASVPAHADVLVVGDSQTWGFEIGRDEAFSAVLATTTGMSSYQMANGSYGPVQYRELVRQGLALRPRLVVVAFYFGNDLLDAFDYAGLEGAEDLRSDGVSYFVRHNREFDPASAPNWTMALVDGVLGASRVLDFAADVVKSRLRGGVLEHEPGAVAFADARVPTLLLPEYRRHLVDCARDSVRDGVRISGRCFADIARQCATASARCVLLAIPTKEYCYAEWQNGKRTPGPELRALHDCERACREEIFAQAAAAGCEVADLAPVCVAALAAGTAPWPASGDGHLNAAGHREAARLLARCCTTK